MHNLRVPSFFSLLVLSWYKLIAAVLIITVYISSVSGSNYNMAFRIRSSAAISASTSSGRLSKSRHLKPSHTSLTSLHNNISRGRSTSTTAAFVSSSSQILQSKSINHNTVIRTSLPTQSSHQHKSYFSSMAIPSNYMSPLFATIPTTDESYDDTSLDFTDLDIFKDSPTKHEEEVDIGDNPPIDEAEFEEKDVQSVVNGKKDDKNNNINNKPKNNKENKEKKEEEEEYIIKSKPKKNGNWNPSNPLGWCQSFGSRSKTLYSHLEQTTKLTPDSPDYNDMIQSSTLTVPDVTIVRTKQQASIVLQKLQQDVINNPWRIHACDTEVMDIDLKNVGPVGHGYVTCLSVYSGPDFDYGIDDEGNESSSNGSSSAKGTMLWIDNLDDAQGLLQEFKDWLEDSRVLKVWHNYGFDRHVLYNEGINVKGFGGDTMHMARLSDTSRMKYSLESLTEDLLGQRKVPMKEIFGEPRLRKDGTPGAIIDLPPMEKLQRHPKYRQNWIKYSAFDAKSTYNLYRHLENKLEKTPWFNKQSLMDYYREHMRPFGELLTDLERRGILVATDYLADVEVQARKDRVEHVNTFRKWAAQQIGPDGLAMNLASSVQLSTFLFGGAENSKTKERSEMVRVFKTPRADIPDEAMEAYRQRDALLKEEKENNASFTTTDGDEVEEDEFDQMKAAELKVLCKEYGLKMSGKKAELQQRLRGHFQMMNNPETSESMLANVDDYDSMTVKDLRDACATRGIPSSGKKKAALIKELRADDSMIREVTAEHMKAPNTGADSSIAYRKISELLEEAVASGENDALKTILADIKAKNEEEPKYVDVKITSLGMVPDKFTSGGAPSATADVLRKLAGDPFADPPNYGKVSVFGSTFYRALLSSPLILLLIHIPYRHTSSSAETKRVMMHVLPFSPLLPLDRLIQ